SAQPQEGKSFSAVNLAVALAEAGEPALLVDADLRRSSCHRAFGLEPPSVGLSSILYRGLPPEVALLTPRVPNLTFLPAGPPPPHPPAPLPPGGGPRGGAAPRGGLPPRVIDSPPGL